MKKKFLSSLLFAALVGGAVSTFTACKDYDDDINNLQKQIDDQAKLLKELQEKINSGCVITNVEPITGGTRVTLSDGNHFDVLNGAKGEPGVAGKNGTVWTIGSDGYWYKDEGNGAVKTDYKALGTDADKWTIGSDGYWYLNGEKTDHKATGTDADKWTIGDDGYWYLNGDKTNHKATGADGSGSAGKDGQTIYYKPNGEGYFDKCHLDENGNEVVDQKNAVEIAVKGAVSASIDSEYLIFTGVTSAENGTVKISLTSDLRSLVFMPKLYLDGIETVKYPWIQTTTKLVNKTGLTGTNHQNKTVKNLEDYEATGTVLTCNYGPVWPVDYHMNPSNSNVKSEDVKDFYVLNSDVIYTRATAKYDISYKEKTDYGKAIFSNAEGVLTVGMQVANPQDLVSEPTKLQQNDDQVIALQVESKSSAATNGIITSDYALIRPMKTTVEGLVWVQKPMYGVIKPADRTETGDMNCSLTNTKIHVWDNPQDAVKDSRKAALELYYDSETGITISDYLGICYQQEDVNPNKTTLHNGVWKYGDEKDYGLTYEFKLVDYIVDGNKTADSKFAKMLDASKGQIRAWNVKYDGNNYPEEGATSQSTIGRQPLVQVVVKDHCGRVILDGYILVNISAEAPIEADNKVIDWQDKPERSFDLCNDKETIKSNWSQFNDWVLTQEMENMTKENFDLQYEIDYDNSVVTRTAPDGGTIYTLNIYKEAAVKGGADAVADNFNFGVVEYTENTMGTTNHVFEWTVPADILEAWTHDTNLPVTKSIYVRYKAIAGAGAKYPYIYVKFTANFKRDNVGSVKFEEKNKNYWYALDGNDEGTEAIVLDVNEPRDGMDIKNISHEINKTLVGNAPKAAGKYYFVPEEYEIKAQDGVTYVVTPQGTATDKTYKTLYCKYVTAPIADTHEYNKATLDELLNKCAIDYTQGAFANSKLYAHVTGSSTYVKIATLNQTTGEIILEKNETTKAVLNAVGYAENHANINKEMRATLGFVSANDCAVAKIVEDNIFLASWQRPINLKKFDNHVIVDANTNGNYISILDFLKLFDWRGEKVGYMWDDQQWFWAYYGVKAITIDLDPNHVTTDMHNGVLGTTKLKDITRKVNLVNVGSGQADAYTYTFDLTNYHGDNYNMASMSAALVADMKAHPEDFGCIYYENNGENVTKFTVRIPVTVEYEWGKLIETIDITIERTAGH